MPTYQYKARDKYGKAVTGVMDGADEKELIDNLKKMGYAPISVTERKQEKPLLKMQLFSRIKDEDMVLFTRQMHTLLKAGLPLLSGLEATGKQTSSTLLKEAISRIKADVEGGLSFSEALSKHPRIFPSLYVSMVKAGEASGLLDEIMRRLAELGEYEIEVKSEIRSATRYPMLAFATLIVAFFIIVTFVIPKFATIFAQFQVELPLPTRILLGTYRIIHDWWHITLIAVAVIIIAFIKFINTSFGRNQWDGFKLKVPIFGPLLFKLSMSRFAKTTGILVASGIEMLKTLELAADTVGNVIIARAVRYIKEGVNEGKGLAEPMKVSGFFTPVVVQMVSIGEETGKLDELLMNVAEHYDQQISYAMKNLTTMIEPLFILVLAAMVLFVAMGIFLPMWNLLRLFKM